MEVDPKLDVMAQQASNLSSGLCAARGAHVLQSLARIVHDIWFI